MNTDQIGSIKQSSKLSKLKSASAATAKRTEEMKGAKRTDHISLSHEAKEAIELNRFVDLLRNMQEVRSIDLSKEIDTTSPHILREVAKKIAEAF
jgi:hypothetical protein